MIRFLAPTIVALLLLAGCGGDDDGGGGGGGDPLAALATAVEKTADSESFRARFTMESDLEGEQLTFEGEGTFSADSTRGRLRGTMNLGQGDLAFEAIAVDGTMYLKGDQIPVPAGKEWLELPDPPTSTLSPSEFAKFLRDSEGVKNVGTEQIRGEQATHFRGPLDLQKLAEESGSEIGERLRNTPWAESVDFIIDIWVAPDGLPSRIAADISMPDQTQGSLKVTSDVLEYDVEVDAEKPPASSVATGAAGA
jgi:hypothetical protein